MPRPTPGRARPARWPSLRAAQPRRALRPGFGQSVEVEIMLNDAESRKRVKHKTEDEKEKYFLFHDGEMVSGKVSLALKHPNKLEHQGIKIEFIGQFGQEQMSQ